MIKDPVICAALVLIISVVAELPIRLLLRFWLVNIRYFGHYQIMKQEDVIEVFAALAQPTRISVFRLLVQVGPDGLPALEIARRLDVVSIPVEYSPLSRREIDQFRGALARVLPTLLTRDKAHWP
ncbi:MAG: helix-turn-helix domain-containing protein [Pseudomonadota bacterium]